MIRGKFLPSLLSVNAESSIRAFLLSTVFAFSANAAFAAGATVTEIKLPDMPLGEAIYSGGKTLTLNCGIGSAVLRDPIDVAGVVWTIIDRGLNLDCEGIDKLTGLGFQRVGLLRIAAFMNRTVASAHHVQPTRRAETF